MRQIMEFTAWPMEALEAYGWVYNVIFIGGVIIAILLAFLLRNISIKKRNKVLLVCGIILLLMEVYKQLFYTFGLDVIGYKWQIFPFQICSIPMYLCLALPFIKNKKITELMLIFMMCFNLLGGLISFFVPTMLIRSYVTLTIHTFLWHVILIFIGVFIGLHKDTKVELKNFKKALFLFLGLSLVALILNLMLNDLSYNAINLFYVGPNANGIFFFSDIYINYGWYICTLVLIFMYSLGSFLLYYFFYLVKKIFIADKNKNDIIDKKIKV